MISLLKEYKYTYSVIVLLVLTFTLYFKSIFFQYTWDDYIILDNELVYNGLEYIKELFIRKESILLKNNFGFRPLTLLSFKLEFLIFGVNEKYSHLFNILIYLICILLLFFIIKKHTSPKNMLILLIGLALFSFHPIHVEVVSNVKSRDELLGFFFSLLGIISVLRGLKKNKLSFILISLILFLFAMLSKEIEAILLIITSIALIYFYPLKRKKIYLFSSFGFFIIVIIFPYVFYYRIALYITLLFLIFVLDIFLNHTDFKNTFKNWILSFQKKIIFLIISGTTSLIYFNRFKVIHFLNKYPTKETNQIYKDIVKEDYILGNQFIHLNLVELIPNSFNVLLKYLENFFYPVHLKYYYGFNQIPLIDYMSFRFFSSFAIHMFFIWLVFYFRKKDKLLSFLSLSYLVSISIFSHLVIKLPDTMADRFFFIPSIFLSFLSVLLIQKIYYKINFPSKLKKPIVTSLYLLILIALFSLSFQRQNVWVSNKALFSSDLPKLSNCSRCHYNLAIELSKEFETTKNIELKEKIIFHFKKSIEIFPNTYHGKLKLALMYNMFGEPDESIILLNELINNYKEKSEPYFEKGKLLFEKENYLESFKYFDKSIQLFKNNPDYYYYQSWAAFNINRIENAIQISKIAKDKFPSNYMFPDALFEFYMVLEEKTKATQELETYLAQYPNNQIIRNKLNRNK
ncbi:MAG: hypothetical protein ACI8ZX_001065 [Planctomycetota bacterium]|jgi:hypothetical protein